MHMYVEKIEQKLDLLNTKKIYKKIEEDKLYAYLKAWKRNMKKCCKELKKIEDAMTIEWMIDGTMPKKPGRYTVTVLNKKEKETFLDELYWNGLWWGLVCGAGPISEKFEIIGWKDRTLPLDPIFANTPLK